MPSAAASSAPPPVAPGPGVALITLFSEDGRLLASDTAQLAAQVVGAGAASVLVAGTVGEFYTLEDAERVELIAAVRAAVPADVPVVAHVGGVPEARVRQLIRAAVDSGADVLIALAREVADIRAYYDRILTAADGVPVMAYHLPAAGSVVPLSQIADLGLAGIKDSGSDAARFAAEVVTTTVDTYTGTAYLLGLAHDLGAAGALLGLANSHPELAVRAFAGDRDAQRDLVMMSVGLASDFPARIKQLARQRWDVPAVARTPSKQSIAQLMAGSGTA